MRIAFLFPGQGSQYPGMADPWLDDKRAKRVLHKCSKVLGWDVVEASRDPEALKRTDIVQPAIFACDLAAYAVLRGEGVPCHAAAGHSLGEYAALVAGGALDLKHGLQALAVRLQVAGAFHSPLMDSAVQPVREAISRINFHTPRFPVVPNASGKPTTQPLVLRDLLSRHLSSTVKWDASLRAMAEMGITHFIEAGPGDVLAKLARRAVPGAEVRTVGSPDEARAVGQEIRQPAAVR